METKTCHDPITLKAGNVDKKDGSAWTLCCTRSTGQPHVACVATLDMSCRYSKKHASVEVYYTSVDGSKVTTSTFLGFPKRRCQ